MNKKKFMKFWKTICGRNYYQKIGNKLPVVVPEEESEWTFEYDADELPQDSNLGFLVDGDIEGPSDRLLCEVEDGVFHMRGKEYTPNSSEDFTPPENPEIGDLWKIQTGGDITEDGIYIWDGESWTKEYAYDFFDNYPQFTLWKIDNDISSDTGATIEFRMKQNLRESGGGSNFWLDTPKGGAEFDFNGGQVFFGETGVPMEFDLENYHIYRITIKDDVATFYIDDVEVQQIQDSTYSDGSFGDTGDIYIDGGIFYKNNVYIDYIYYRTDGAFAPEE